MWAVSEMALPAGGRRSVAASRASDAVWTALHAVHRVNDAAWTALDAVD